MEPKEKLALIKINAAYLLKTDWISALLAGRKPSEILSMSPAELSREGGISPEKAAKFLAITSALNPEKELEQAAGNGLEIICFGEKNYPAVFAELYEPPAAFYVRGRLNDKLSLGVVGTRKPTDYGAGAAAEIAGKIARAGINIVSGLARGIDTVAHRSALKNKGITFAVTGAGLDSVYPPENRRLAAEIADSGGAVISEYPFSTRPLPFNFPRRNRLISALSWGTLVIEGDYNSGALITARYALEQNREVMALPGPVTSPMSNGPNSLIKDGAFLVRNARDVVETIPASLLFGVDMKSFREKEKEGENISEKVSQGAEKIYRLIKEYPEVTPDEISHKTNLGISEVSNFLFELESSSLVLNAGGKYKISLF